MTPLHALNRPTDRPMAQKHDLSSVTRSSRRSSTGGLEYGETGSAEGFLRDKPGLVLGGRGAVCTHPRQGFAEFWLGAARCSWTEELPASPKEKDQGDMFQSTGGFRRRWFPVTSVGDAFPSLAPCMRPKRF